MSRVLNLILGVVVLLLASTHAATTDTADAIETWTEEKLARVARRQQLPRAVIWSQRCERRGMDAIALRADREPYKIRCVPRVVLRLPDGWVL